jgi:hypothetical protein
VNSEVGHTQELPGNMKMNLPIKILVMICSSASIGFGIWHFFVPRAWNWYSYIDINATELVAAGWMSEQGKKSSKCSQIKTKSISF